MSEKQETGDDRKIGEYGVTLADMILLNSCQRNGWVSDRTIPRKNLPFRNEHIIVTLERLVALIRRDRHSARTRSKHAIERVIHNHI